MSQELLSSANWNQYTSTSLGTCVLTADGLTLSGNKTWARTDYIPLPTEGNITYQYDFDISVSANNQVYIQIERYDANKETINNQGAANIVSGYLPTTDISYEKRKGDISQIKTFGDNVTTAFIRVRVGTGYGETSGTFTVHSWSLKAINNNSIQQASIQKNGQLLTDTFKENNTIAAFNKNGFIEGQHLYEY